MPQVCCISSGKKLIFWLILGLGSMQILQLVIISTILTHCCCITMYLTGNTQSMIPMDIYMQLQNLEISRYCHRV